MDNNDHYPPQYDPNLNPEPEETPEVDRKTTIKAAVVGGVVVTVIGIVIALIQGFFAGQDPSLTYRTIADARAKIVDYAVPKPATNKNFSLYVPENSRSVKEYEINLQDFKGKPVILNFWASWCQPCRKEMRTLDSMYDELTDLGAHVVPIMTSDKSGLDGARYFFRGEGIEKLPLMLDRGTNLMREFQLRALPAIFYIDAEGNVLGSSDTMDIGQVPAQDLLRYFAQTGKLP